jgi:hypothetical protein
MLMDTDIAANGCRILIGGPTHELVKQHFVTRFIKTELLSGKNVPVDIYGVIGERTVEPEPGADGHSFAGATSLPVRQAGADPVTTLSGKETA